MIKELLQGISHIVAPRICRVCGQTLTQHEDVFCLKCLIDIPRTNLHRQTFNTIHQRLGHNSPIDRAAGWFYYKRQSPYAQLLIDAKYSNLPQLDYKLGQMCAQELRNDHFFDGIDLLAPMPMHWFKKLKRGYNQANEICRGISSITGIPICRALIATKSHGVQARHSKDLRYSSIAGTLAISDPLAINGKHVLFVDDIITSGASASEAVRTLHTASPASINVLCLGLTILQ